MGCPAPTAFRLAQGVGRTSRREWPVSWDGTPRDVVERGAGNWAIKPTRSLPMGRSWCVCGKSAGIRPRHPAVLVVCPIAGREVMRDNRP